MCCFHYFGKRVENLTHSTTSCDPSLALPCSQQKGAALSPRKERQRDSTSVGPAGAHKDATLGGPEIAQLTQSGNSVSKAGAWEEVFLMPAFAKSLLPNIYHLFHLEQKAYSHIAQLYLQHPLQALPAYTLFALPNMLLQIVWNLHRGFLYYGGIKLLNFSKYAVFDKHAS